MTIHYINRLQNRIVGVTLCPALSSHRDYILGYARDITRPLVPISAKMHASRLADSHRDPKGETPLSETMRRRLTIAQAESQAVCPDLSTSGQLIYKLLRAGVVAAPELRGYADGIRFAGRLAAGKRAAGLCFSGAHPAARGSGAGYQPAPIINGCSGAIYDERDYAR
jgi:hypothetical protein